MVAALQNKNRFNKLILFIINNIKSSIFSLKIQWVYKIHVNTSLIWTPKEKAEVSVL